MLPNIPYVFIGWVFLKLGTAYRLAAGGDFAHKFIGLGQTVGAAFAPPPPPAGCGWGGGGGGCCSSKGKKKENFPGWGAGEEKRLFLGGGGPPRPHPQKQTNMAGGGLSGGEKGKRFLSIPSLKTICC